MKQYPDVYYTLNELADLSGYDRKGFKDRLIRVCEMYSIPIEEFKIYPDEKIVDISLHLMLQSLF